MKTTKKRFLSIIIIAMMTFCLGAFNVTASAEGDYSITISKQSGSAVSIANTEFEAYKVFNVSIGNGSYNYDTDKTTTVDEEYVDENGKKYTPSSMTEGTDGAADTVKAFNKFFYNKYIKTGKATAAGSETAGNDENGVTIYVDSPGYYAIYGKNANGDTNFISLLTVEGKENVTLKLDAPTLEKKIWHDELTENNWQDVGDNQIGDMVKFRLKTTVPDLSNYTAYKYIIHDEMDACFLPEKENGEIKVSLCSDENGTNPISGLTYSVNDDPEDDCTFHIEITNILSANLDANSSIYTFYQAKLTNTSGVKVASQKDDSTNHNDNTAWLEYSCNPYDETGKETAITTKDTVYDWTFIYGINKVDDSKPANPLAGAVFEITNKNTNQKLIFKYIDDNTYIVEHNVAEADNKTTYFDQIKSPESEELTKKGKFIIQGLDDSDEYEIHEVAAPDGYSTTNDIKFILTSEYNKIGSTLTKIEDASSALAVDIVNKKGNVLVGTGGIGTTIFYIVGGALMAGAVVLLIVRKRINNK